MFLGKLVSSLKKSKSKLLSAWGSSSICQRDLMMAARKTESKAFSGYYQFAKPADHYLVIQMCHLHD